MNTAINICCTFNCWEVFKVVEQYYVAIIVTLHQVLGLRIPNYILNNCDTTFILTGWRQSQPGENSRFRQSVDQHFSHDLHE
jgi:hypothetical protein